MRLIDADALKHSIAGNIPLMPTVRIAIEHRIDDAPTIEAEPMVRCKDCKWFRDSNGIDGFCYCDRIYRHCGTHWYCADGERKDGKE